MTENKQELNKSGFKQITLYDLLWPKKCMMVAVYGSILKNIKSDHRNIEYKVITKSLRVAGFTFLKEVN